jgi:hypothetical protein
MHTSTLEMANIDTFFKLDIDVGLRGALRDESQPFSGHSPSVAPLSEGHEVRKNFLK